MSKHFDENLYKATVNACYESGVPDNLTFKAAEIVASDTPGAPDLGRTPQDQEIIKEVFSYFRSRGKQE